MAHPQLAPELAVQARTSVDCARVGALTTYARQPQGRSTCSVSLSARPDGTLELQLAADAVAARQLIARPVATLRVAPVGCEPVLLHGSARRLPGPGRRGTLVFHLQVAAVRVGHPSVPVEEAAYSAAEPDPLRHDAPAVLAHLNAGHTDALGSCLRAVGHDADFALATRLDARGLTLTAVTAAGAEPVRLSFPRPVARLSDLPPSLNCVLSPRCGCAHPGPDDPAAG